MSPTAAPAADDTVAGPTSGKKSATKSTIAADVRLALDEAIQDVRAGTQTWSHLTLDQRARLIERLHGTVSAVAEEWADVSSTSKGIEAGHPLRGEEWLGGPYATLVALDAYRDSLRKLAAGKSPLDGVKTDTVKTDVAQGRLRAHVFPLSPVDSLLLSGFTGEVWFEPGVTAGEAWRNAGLGQRTPTESGGVGLVLGAGNVTSIPVLDVIYELLAANRTVILKVNPTQDPLVPVFTRALAPLIEIGFLRIVQGDGEIGAHLTTHPGIDHVHITGAARTFDTIVWGPSTGAGAAATARRRKDGTPQLDKPITAELGGVSPIIIVPGKWTDADLKYQAEHVATMRLQNSGHNCIAGQVVLLSSEWPQRAAFLAALHTAYADAPQRPVWYPRADASLAAAASSYPDAQWCADGTRAIVEIGPGDDATALQSTEYFSPVLGIVELPGTGQEFLDRAVAHANDELTGTLGANILIDPVTEAALGDGLERALVELRYGDIAVNAWTAFIFLTPTMTWGAFPGGTVDDVQSGIGVVHNALLLDRVERSVTRGPFRPFPRSAGAVTGRGTFSVLPKPPWFVSSRTGAVVSEGFTRFRMTGNWAKLMVTLTQAFRA